MTDQELQAQFEKLHQEIEEAREAAADKGHGVILFFLIILFLRGC